MSDVHFDVEAVFDASDYLYFHRAALTPERTGREIELIWRLLELHPGMAVLDLAYLRRRAPGPRSRSEASLACCGRGGRV